jgi:hypothetical protein
MMYDLIEIIWNDESLLARPIKWNVDTTAQDFNPEESEDVIATNYELVCPGCGSMCLFSINSLEIKCEECDSSTNNPAYINQSSVDLKTEDQPIIENQPTIGLINDEDEVEISDSIFDSLHESILNTEMEVETPEETPEETPKKTTKKKTTKKKTTKKKTTKKTKKESE